MEKLDDELVEILTAAGAALMTDDEIAILCGCSIEEYRLKMEDRTSEFYTTIMKARLTTQMEVRTKIIENAKQGSSPAQTLVVKLLESEILNRLT